ncbi:hypothetical protein [Burkholderia plantarii]|uniref:hypothetical protein n=1 Tax=Burkholderia plantarii TaxID=41899 RepID=UPI000F4E7F4F|nr:hypothetical protein [Burkholderia plantarii]
MEIDARNVLAPQDFSACPIWRYDNKDDLYHPVASADQLPESERVLSIHANFRAPDGRVFAGYVVGIERIFSFGLFAGERIFHVNLKLPDLSAKQLDAFFNCNRASLGKYSNRFFH